MGQQHDAISPELAAWIERQRVFFVATAPLAHDGRVNCSPKGLETFRVLDPRRVAYLDLTGSGAETVAHVRENGRIVFMFCAFEGPPRIVRLHGAGRFVPPTAPEWTELRTRFPDHPGARGAVVADVARVSTSCGYAVPRFEFVEPRDRLDEWTAAKGPDGLAEYRRRKNARSIDGLPALDP